jgi:hypothetical protein
MSNINPFEACIDGPEAPMYSELVVDPCYERIIETSGSIVLVNSFGDSPDIARRVVGNLLGRYEFGDYGADFLLLAMSDKHDSPSTSSDFRSVLSAFAIMEVLREKGTAHNPNVVDLGNSYEDAMEAIDNIAADPSGLILSRKVVVIPNGTRSMLDLSPNDDRPGKIQLLRAPMSAS